MKRLKINQITKIKDIKHKQIKDVRENQGIDKIYRIKRMKTNMNMEQSTKLKTNTQIEDYTSKYNKLECDSMNRIKLNRLILFFKNRTAKNKAIICLCI